MMKRISLSGLLVTSGCLFGAFGLYAADKAIENERRFLVCMGMYEVKDKMDGVDPRVVCDQIASQAKPDFD